MEIWELMKQRHSVRRYKDIAVDSKQRAALDQLIEEINGETGLHIQAFYNEPRCFDSIMAHYGKFSGVKNYIALVGKRSPKLDETLGYYGEQIVLKIQELGLNSCWVAMTYKKIPGAFQVNKGEKLTVVIALGYGKTQGVPHHSKPAEAVSNIRGDSPAWFKAGVEAALLAPTAMNQQKFTLTYQNGQVTAKAGKGFYTAIDLGIVKYHFEIGAGREHRL